MGLCFEFPIIKLNDYRDRLAELTQMDNPFALITAAYLKALSTRKDPKQRFVDKRSLTALLYEKGFSRQTVIRLFLFIDWVMALPEPLERRFQDELANFEGERNMPYVTSIERFALKRGREEGREEGRELGLARSLSMILTHRYGAVPESIREKMTQGNAVQLEAWLERLIAGEPAEQVFAGRD